MPLTDRDRRTIKIGGIIAAVLLVGLLLVGQLGKGGEEALPPINPITGSPGGATGPSPSVSGTPTTIPSAPGGGVFFGRDPFSPPPIFVTFSPTSPTSPGQPPPTSPGTTSPTSPGTTSPGTTSPTAPSGGSSTMIGGHTVVLLDTFIHDGQETAQVEVDGTVYNVTEGDTFAGGDFELRSISGDCATFLFGDESFTLCATHPK